MPNLHVAKVLACNAAANRGLAMKTGKGRCRHRSILAGPMFKFLSRLGDSNEREVRALEPLAERINALEAEIQALTDDELRDRTRVLRERLRESIGDILVPIELRAHDADEDAADSALTGADAARVADELKQQRERELKRINDALEELLPEAFAAVREAMVRALGKRHYDVQLMGGIVLHRGAIG